MPPKDSIQNTFLVSLVLCVVCSLLVSSAYVLLKGFQVANKELDVKRNILAAAGLKADRDGAEIEAKKMRASEIDAIFEERVEKKMVELASGEYVPSPDPKFDPRKAAKIEEQSDEIAGGFDIGQPRRPKQTWVYLIKSGEDIEQVVIPVYGMGLWSTLYGYIAIDKDLTTVKGLTYYEHAETPGLGGEVENPAWKSKWVGKKIYDDGVTPASAKDENIRLGVAKGAPVAEEAPYQVDGLSGATITSRGVDTMLKYWFSSNAFGPYLKRLASEQGA